MYAYNNLEAFDDYGQELSKQNSGKYCGYCGSASGHYLSCVLLSGALPSKRTKHEALIEKEKRSNISLFSEDDKIIAHALGVKL